MQTHLNYRESKDTRIGHTMATLRRTQVRAGKQLLVGGILCPRSPQQFGHCLAFFLRLLESVGGSTLVIDANSYSEMEGP